MHKFRRENVVSFLKVVSTFENVDFEPAGGVALLVKPEMAAGPVEVRPLGVVQQQLAHQLVVVREVLNLLGVACGGI